MVDWISAIVILANYNPVLVDHDSSFLISWKPLPLTLAERQAMPHHFLFVRGLNLKPKDTA
jgi:hypothetical protein